MNPVENVEPTEQEITIVVGGGLQHEEITDGLTKTNLMNAKIQAVRAFPFMAYLLMATRYRMTTSLPTAAATVIGSNQYVILNPKFFNEMLTNEEQRIFVVMHEQMHIFLHHIGRQTEAGYHPRLWNVATDFMINAFLFHIGEENKQNGKVRIEMPKFGLFDDKYYRKSADEIYHMLLEEHGGNAEKACEANGAGKGKCITVRIASGKQGPLDEVGREQLTTGEKLGINQKISATMTSYATQDQKNIGEAAAGLMRIFNSYIEERVNWKQVLREYIISACKSRNTYARNNRRSNRVIFPAMTGDHVNIGFGGDTSGSMSADDLGEVQNELRSIMANFESWEIDFVTCDTQVHSIGHYESENGDTYDNISMDMIGGGGTDMNPMVEHFNNGGNFNNTEGEIVTIIATDGFIPPITADSEHPVIVVVTSNGNKSLETDNPDVTIIKMEK